MTDLWKTFIHPPRSLYPENIAEPRRRRLDQDTTYLSHEGKVKNHLGHSLIYNYFELDLSKEPRTATRQQGFDGTPPCMIYLHSHGGSRHEGFNLLRYCGQLRINFCFFDFSGHGESEGEYTTAGYYEHKDLEAIVQEIRMRFQVKKVILWGRSMGAVVALQYAYRHPKDVDFLVLDSPFTSVEQMVRDVGGRYLKLGEYVALFLFSMSKDEIMQRIGVDLFELRPIELCPHIDTACVFVVGNKDDLVPPERVDEMFRIYKGAARDMIVVEGTHSSARSDIDLDKIVKHLEMFYRIQRRIPSGISNQNIEQQIAEQVLSKRDPLKNFAEGFAKLDIPYTKQPPIGLARQRNPLLNTEGESSTSKLPPFNDEYVPLSTTSNTQSATNLRSLIMSTQKGGYNQQKDYSTENKPIASKIWENVSETSAQINPNQTTSGQGNNVFSANSHPMANPNSQVSNRVNQMSRILGPQFQPHNLLKQVQQDNSVIKSSTSKQNRFSGVHGLGHNSKNVFIMGKQTNLALDNSTAGSVSKSQLHLKSILAGIAQKQKEAPNPQTQQPPPVPSAYNLNTDSEIKATPLPEPEPIITAQPQQTLHNTNRNISVEFKSSNRIQHQPQESSDLGNFLNNRNASLTQIKHHGSQASLGQYQAQQISSASKQLEGYRAPVAKNEASGGSFVTPDLTVSPVLYKRTMVDPKQIRLGHEIRRIDFNQPNPNTLGNFGMSMTNLGLNNSTSVRTDSVIDNSSVNQVIGKRNLELKRENSVGLAPQTQTSINGSTRSTVSQIPPGPGQFHSIYANKETVSQVPQQEYGTNSMQTNQHLQQQPPLVTFAGFQYPQAYFHEPRQLNLNEHNFPYHFTGESQSRHLNPHQQHPQVPVSQVNTSTYRPQHLLQSQQPQQPPPQMQPNQHYILQGNSSSFLQRTNSISRAESREPAQPNQRDDRNNSTQRLVTTTAGEEYRTNSFVNNQLGHLGDLSRGASIEGRAARQSKSIRIFEEDLHHHLQQNGRNGVLIQRQPNAQNDLWSRTVGAENSFAHQRGTSQNFQTMRPTFQSSFHQQTSLQPQSAPLQQLISSEYSQPRQVIQQHYSRNGSLDPMRQGRHP